MTSEISGSDPYIAALAPNLSGGPKFHSSSMESLCAGTVNIYPQSILAIGLLSYM